MTCDEIREILSSYADGEARGDEGRLAEEHLSACEACRGLVRRMRLLGDSIGKVEAAVPPGFRDALFSRMEREGLLPRRRSLFVYAVRWAAVPAAAAAALALFVLTSRDAGDRGPIRPAGAPQAMNDRAGPVPEAKGEARAGRPDAETAMPSAGTGRGGAQVADSRVGADLTPEERDIVAHLEVLEDSAVLDEPSGIDELDLGEPAGRKKG